jgi:hypothetical protein
MTLTETPMLVLTCAAFAQGTINASGAAAPMLMVANRAECKTVR